MGWASQSGRAITNPDNPRAFAVCDNCGFWYNHIKLKWLKEWQGTQLVNLGFLVCETCLDKPNPQLKARLMPPDPVPIRNPRPEPWLTPGFMDSILSTEPRPPIWDRPLSTRFDDKRRPMATEKTDQRLQIEPTGPPKPIAPGPGPATGPPMEIDP